jgi:hypothetical protein
MLKLIIQITKRNCFKRSFFVIVLLIYYFINVLFVQAADSSPQFLVSWQAYNYVPSWYTGKILPSPGTLVEVRFDLIDKGKMIDLSQFRVRWYLNNKLIQNENNGLGLQYLKFIVPELTREGDIEIRIVVLDYPGSNVLGKLIKIPVVRPEAVIDAPYIISKSVFGNFIYKAYPFFFNVQNLNDISTQWSFAVNNRPIVIENNNQSADNNRWFININIDKETPANSHFQLSLFIKNKLRAQEFASQRIFW